MDEKFPLALPKGTVLSGQYIIEGVLGQGGFGITYVAKDHKNGTLVAIKEFFPDTMATRDGTTVRSFTGERAEAYDYGKNCFLEEAKTLAQFIDNDNIVRINTYFEENSTAYFVMEYVEGESLDEYIKKKGGRLGIEEACSLLLPVMEALAAVHEKGIVHRDVTPDNIFVCNDGKVKLLDFGAARYSIGDKSKSLDVVLKHGFAPKEQYTRHGKQGAFTDVYSLGATFYYAITGKKLPDSIDRLEEDDMVPPSNLGVNITEEMEEVLFKAVSVQPQDRYQTMREFAAALKGEPQDIGRTVPVTSADNGIGKTVPLDMSVQTTQNEKKGIAGILSGMKKNKNILLPAAIIGGSVVVVAIIVVVLISGGRTKKNSDLEKPEEITVAKEDETPSSGGDTSGPDEDIPGSNENPEPQADEPTDGFLMGISEVTSADSFDDLALSNINNGGYVAEGERGTYVFVPGEGLCLYPPGSTYYDNNYTVLVKNNEDEIVGNINVVGDEVLYTINGIPYMITNEGTNEKLNIFGEDVVIRRLFANEDGCLVEEVGDINDSSVPDKVYFYQLGTHKTTEPFEVKADSDIAISSKYIFYVDTSGALGTRYCENMEETKIVDTDLGEVVHIAQCGTGMDETLLVSHIFYREESQKNVYRVVFLAHTEGDESKWDGFTLGQRWGMDKNEYAYDVDNFDYSLLAYYNDQYFCGSDNFEPGVDYTKNPSIEIHVSHMPNMETGESTNWFIFYEPVDARRYNKGLCFARSLNEYFYYYRIDEKIYLHEDVVTY